MIIPSIDISEGQTVQLIGGEEHALSAGDPRPLAERFGRIGEVAVIDLDAAKGTGDNRALIEPLLTVAPCRVGGGIRDYDRAAAWLDAGAARIIIGTAAQVPLLKKLPKSRLIAALDARDGEVVTHGWRTKTGRGILELMRELAPWVGGFLVTFVEREGRLGGTNLERVPELVEAAQDARVTIAGGVTTVQELAQLHTLGADAQVGMALYTGKLSLSDAFLAPAGPGPWPAACTDESGRLLGLRTVDRVALHTAIQAGALPATPEHPELPVQKIELQADGAALKLVAPSAAAGFSKAAGLPRLERTLSHRKQHPTEGSYTNRLLDRPALLNAKIQEEAQELTEADAPDALLWEAADVVYFTMVKLAAHDLTWSQVEEVLDRRAQKVSRRKGDAKVPLRDEASPRLERKTVQALLPAQDGQDLHAQKTVRPILEAVQKEGLAAVQRYAEHFGEHPQGAPSLLRTKAQLQQTLMALDEPDRALLRRTHARIEAFAKAQLQSLSPIEVEVPGGRAGHDLAPIERVGCYAPGGRYPLPSSVLMTATVARVAGAKQVWVASPKPTKITEAAAAIAGADGLLCAGGAQAIAALAYGAGDIPSVDMIVGPGNRYVTAAKQLVFGHVGIDMLAGPSELVVLADASANPELIAADLLAQAEHDVRARPILVTNDDALVDRVNAALLAQVEDLPTAEVAKAALQEGGAVVCETLQEAVRASDRLAPEHLSLMVKDPELIRPQLNHYGALFIDSAEVFGDYGIGPNHVLPTGRSARFCGGLSVLDFLRVRTWLRASPPRSLIEDAAALARLEGLQAHARSALWRGRAP